MDSNSPAAAATSPALPTRSQPIEVIDMHTGGEPLRIITRGYPAIPGSSILDKRRYARSHLDHLRQFVMFEPRGHYDMYGAVLVEPSLPGADMAVLFIHNEGYSTMCGHAVIALGRYAVDYGLVPAIEPITIVNIECPCGMVQAEVEVTDGQSGKVRFRSVPSFMFGGDIALTLADGREFVTDIGYGGAFYAVLDARQFGLDVGQSPVRALIDTANAVCRAVNGEIALHHPDHDDLAFLYGAILTDGRDGGNTGASRNICVFADSQVDRSPTGSGVSARLAIAHAKGLIATGVEKHYDSVIGSRFAGRVAATTSCGPHAAIIAEVTGMAHYSAEARFWYDPAPGFGPQTDAHGRDQIGCGFILR